MKGYDIKILKDRDVSLEDFKAGFLSIDTEFMGLEFRRDRLCVIQIFQPYSKIVRIILLGRKIDSREFPNLIYLLENKNFIKIFHYAFADLAQLAKTFKAKIRNIVCTRTMSRIVRSFQNSHSLQSLVKEILKFKLSKDSSSSYWGSGELSSKQIIYAVKDVLFLHLIYLHLRRMSQREQREEAIHRMHVIIPLAVENYLEEFSTEELLRHH